MCKLCFACADYCTFVLISGVVPSINFILFCKYLFRLLLYYNFVCNSLSRDWTNLALSLTLSFHGERSRTWTLTGRTITWNRRDQQRPFPHRTHFYRSRPMWEASGKGIADDVEDHRQTQTSTPQRKHIVVRKLRYISIHMCRHG